MLPFLLLFLYDMWAIRGSETNREKRLIKGGAAGVILDLRNWGQALKVV